MPSARRRSRRAFTAAGLGIVLAVAVAAGRQQPDLPRAATPDRHWLVIFALAKKLDAATSIPAQPGFAEHVANVRKLAADGVMVVGGPLLQDFESGTPDGAIFVLVATSEAEARRIAAADPLVTHGTAEIASVRAFAPGVGKWLESKPTHPSRDR